MFISQLVMHHSLKKFNRKMCSKLFICITILIFIISFSNAKIFFTDKNNFELTNENANLFLHTNPDEYS